MAGLRQDIHTHVGEVCKKSMQSALLTLAEAGSMGFVASRAAGVMNVLTFQPLLFDQGHIAPAMPLCTLVAAILQVCSNKSTSTRWYEVSNCWHSEA